MIIRIYEINSQDTDIPNIELSIDNLDVSTVQHLKLLVGEKLTIEQLDELCSNLQPSGDQERDDSYFLQNASVWVNGNPIPTSIDVPHYLGIKAVLNSVITKYKSAPNIRIIVL